MHNHITRIPRTAMELFELLPEGVNCQVINNQIIVSPAPLFHHQEIVNDIALPIYAFIKKHKLGKSVQSPIDVFLDKENAFQPDIIFISNNNLHIIKDGKVKGAPDMVVEVLSKGTEEQDRVKKKAVYEKAGVKEYFIVDPETKLVNVFYLQKGKYKEQKATIAKLVSVLLKKSFSF
jgi:Uma2 family endonuclease